MKHKYLEEAKIRLRDIYSVDVLNDIILNRSNRLIFFADISKKTDIDLELISGNLTLIGFPDESSISLGKLFECFDKKNKYAEVAGEIEYFNHIYNDISNFEIESNVSFPIINESGRYWIRFNMVPVDNHPNLVTVFITNVTEFLVKEEELFIKTHRDSLTGTFNKYTLDYHYGERYQIKDFHVLYLDLDNFKMINDTFGHETGNDYLIEFAKILLSFEDNYDRFYRIGGDEFVGFFFQDEESVKQIVKDIISKTEGLSIAKFKTETTVSIGVVQANMRIDVIKKADEALYKAKELGKNQYIYVVES